MNFKSITVAIYLSVTSFSVSAAPIVIYDNFGPNDSFRETSGATIDVSFDQGFQFTASQSGFFTSLDVGMGTTDGPQDVLFSLHNGATSNTIGDLLESLTLTIQNPFGTQATSSASATGSTYLKEGNQYWLLAHSVSGASTPWNYSNVDSDGYKWVNRLTATPPRESIGISSDVSTFRINASVVPIPAAIWLFGSGLLGLIGVARHKKS